MGHAVPLLVDDLKNPREIRRLGRVAREKTVEGQAAFLEDALQSIIDKAPDALPVEEIEPAFADLRSVCRELPLRCGDRVGYLDNLLMTPAGRICLVECKLWQNGGSEREVVAQLLDYASAFAQLDFEGLSSQVQRACRDDRDTLVRRVISAEADEDQRLRFIEGVERSLRRGEFLLLIVGDRIRPGVQRMVQMLQTRATLGFGFGLIEMAIYRDRQEPGHYYVQPRVLLKTEIVTRTVFVQESGRAAPAIAAVSAPSRPTTLTEQEFFASLAAVNPSYPDEVRGLLDRCRALGCETDLQRKYVVYVDDGRGGVLNVGSVVRDGTVTIWGAAAHDEKFGQPLGREYMEGVAALFVGGRVKTDGSPGSWHVRVDERVGIPLTVMMQRRDAWLDLIATLQAKLQKPESDQGDRSQLESRAERFVWRDGDVEITRDATDPSAPALRTERTA